MPRPSTRTPIDLVLHEPTRMTICRHLVRRGGESTASEVFAATGVNYGRQHKHTRALASVGYIHVEKSHNGTELVLTEAGRAAMARYRNAMAAILTELVAS